MTGPVNLKQRKIIVNGQRSSEEKRWAIGWGGGGGCIIYIPLKIVDLKFTNETDHSKIEN